MNSSATSQSDLRSRQLGLAALVLILVSAIVLRAAAAVIVDRSVQQSGRSFLVEGDANGYWQLAQKLAAGEDYAIHQPPRRVLRVPGFPLILAASITVFGDSILAARLLLACVGTACCLLTFLLARQLVGRNVGLVAAGFLAVHPLQITNSVLILSENWFTFWMLLSLISLTSFLKQFNHAAPSGSAIDSEGSAIQPNAKALGKKRLSTTLIGSVTATNIGGRRAALLTGGLIGVTVLIRPGFLPWVGFCVLAILACRRRSWTARAAQSSLIVLGCLLIMMPWALRNQKATGHFVLTSLWSGPSLYDGLNSKATGASDMTFFDEEQVMKTMSEYEMNRHYSGRAVEFAVNNPGRATVLGFHKAGLYLMPVPHFASKRSWVAGGICGVSWFVVFGGALLGVFAVYRDIFGLHSSRSMLFLLITLGPFLLFLLVHLAFVGSVRYRLPVEFPLTILAASGWLSLFFRSKVHFNELTSDSSVDC